MARWTRRVGLFTLALVIVGVVTGGIFWRQLNVMQGQLDEMRSQGELTKVQMMARLRRNQTQATVWNNNGAFAGWNINPVLENIGGTEAIDYEGIWKMVPINKGLGLSAKDCPSPPTIPPGVGRTTEAPGRPFLLGADLLTPQQAELARDSKIAVFGVGTVEYRDIFPDTPQHHYSWCELIVPNDLGGAGTFSFFRLKDETD